MNNENSAVIISRAQRIIILISIMGITGNSVYFLSSTYNVGNSIEATASRIYSISDDSTIGDRHDIMPMEQQFIPNRYGEVKEVLHDNRMMIGVNSFRITDDGNSLITDLTIRNIGHTFNLSPNLFKLKTSSGDIITPSIYHTSLLNAGLRQMYLPQDQIIRTLVAFDSPNFGYYNQDNTSALAMSKPIVLEYSDRSSFFNIALVNSSNKVSQQALDSLGNTIKPSIPALKIGKPITNGSLQLLISNISSSSFITLSNSDDNNANDNSILMKISLTFKNIGNKFPIRIDPSYTFILDNKSYIYGIDKSPRNNDTNNIALLSSPLVAIELEPGKSKSGDVFIKVPKADYSPSNLIFMYASPNNSFIARIANTLPGLIP